MIGYSIVAGLRCYPTLWRNFFLRYKTINLGIGGDRVENVLWSINDVVLPKSVRSVVIHCGTNNIDTNSLGVVTIARSISHHYPNIEVIVSCLLPRDIHWSAQRVKIEKTNAYMRDYCKKSNKMTFMHQDLHWTLPDNLLNIELFYKDHLHLIEKGNIKFSKLITEILQDVLSPKSSSQLSSSRLSQSSLTILLPTSSLSRPHLYSVQTLSQSSSSNTL